MGSEIHDDPPSPPKKDSKPRPFRVIPAHGYRTVAYQRRRAEFLVRLKQLDSELPTSREIAAVMVKEGFLTPGGSAPTKENLREWLHKVRKE